MKNLNTSAYLLILFAFLSCQPEKETTAIFSSDGYWKQLGYGKIINIQDSLISVYDICKVDCHFSFEEGILDFGRIKIVTKDTLIIQHGIDDWKFVRLDQLPKPCSPINDSLRSDPVYNFETFWHTFNENYCSFELKGINWDDIYQEYSTKISKQTSDLALYQYLEEMVSKLNDSHISIEPSEEIQKANQTASSNKQLYSKLHEFKIMEDLAQLYVDSLRSYNGGMVRWGMVNHEIGYIQFNAMWMIADYDVNPDFDLMAFSKPYFEHRDLIKDEVNREDEAEGTNYIMEIILKDLSGAKSIILDLRINGGGKDGVAINLLNHFSNKTKIIATKQAMFRSEMMPKQIITVRPSSNTFNGKVFLLISHQTASAAELTVLGSLANSNFTTIGSKTEGIFSSTLDKTLPNGWEYELSNEIYLDTKGNNYEHVGIEPDHKIDYPKDSNEFFSYLENELNFRNDRSIEMAIKLHNK